MEYFFMMIFFFAFVAAIIFLVLGLFSKKNRSKFTKRALWSIIISVVSFALTLFVLTLPGHGVSKDTDAGSASNSSVASSSSSSSVASSSSSSSVNAKNVEQANAALVTMLTQRQGWANGTLDENGSSTTSGTPNSSYDWAKIITSIKYAEKELTIYVNKDYAGMTKTQFASYMTKAENASLNALQEAGIIDDDTVSLGLYTRVFDGSTKLAQSKVSNLHEFKINQ